MKKLYLTAWALVLLSVISSMSIACHKPHKFMNDAVITGWDYRKCACCGGLLINFEGKTQNYEGNYYQVSNNASALGIDDKTTFPVYMKVDWKKDAVTCGNFITITRFQKK